ncbi:hypothetical protein GCM10025880_38740 [Methylorubrum aminovorans]|nr:hypothetical protein GCM10025880_38740 [Methylorubrum aminovorans]
MSWTMATDLPRNRSASSVPPSAPCCASLPESRNSKPAPRRVSGAQVAPGVTETMPASSKTVLAAALAPEVSGPMTKRTPLAANRRATAAACFGSAASSCTTS